MCNENANNNISDLSKALTPVKALTINVNAHARSHSNKVNHMSHSHLVRDVIKALNGNANNYL